MSVRGRRLEYRRIGPRSPGAPTLVFLHEGLGSVSLWRDFPDRMASATGCGALVYSRSGYGSSDPVRQRRSVRFMHEEALDVLPDVLERFELADVVLFGHSDGASIAIIYAGAHAGNAGSERSPAGFGAVRALVLEAPHVFVEPVCIESIARIARAYETTGLRDKMARYHDHVDSMFRSWTDVWLTPEFRQWNIEEYLPEIDAPVLVVQGENDDYGTLEQVEAVVTRVRGPSRTLVLADCGHSPHSERPDAVLETAARFIRRTLDL